MIFITVGTQLPFNRLINVLDKWAASNPSQEIFAQVGPSKNQPKYFDFANFLTQEETNKYFEKAELIISHAGMGSILSALQLQKNIIVMPRLASYGEHRNDHQLATVKWLEGISGLHIAKDETELIRLIENRQSLVNQKAISPYASAELIQSLKTFVNNI